MVPHRHQPRQAEGADEIGDSEQALSLAKGLTIEDHGSEFYLISEAEGHDFTLTLEAPVAERLAEFILSRRRLHGDVAVGRNKE